MHIYITYLLLRLNSLFFMEKLQQLGQQSESDSEDKRHKPFIQFRYKTFKR